MNPEVFCPLFVTSEVGIYYNTITSITNLDLESLDEEEAESLAWFEEYISVRLQDSSTQGNNYI